jgi:hypothetical protein
VGQLPQFLEALLPWVDVGPVIENERATRLIDMEAAYPVATVRQQMGIGEMAQIVRTLPCFDHV